MATSIQDVSVGIILTVAIGLLVFWQKQQFVPPSLAPDTNPGAFTMDEVAEHNSRDDCWTTINGNVYDLTSWISAHPGGEAAIFQLCGTDGSEPFNAMHGDASEQAIVLKTFKIGELE